MIETISGSFRDPDGFLFQQDGALFRQVNTSCKDNYDCLMRSGLYDTLVEAELLVPHEEQDIAAARPDIAYKIIKPEIIPFISYPNEWCFSQLKDAALITLAIQKKALDFGMTLKDSSAYNIQFIKNRPVFIDTLSFERYEDGTPWVAYRQFCQHFLAPLSLMAYRDIRLNQLFRVYIDGVPLDLASALLPVYTRFVFSLFSHIHLHAKSQKIFAGKNVTINNRKMKKLSLLGLIDNLESAVKKLKWRPQGTEWVNYYDDTNYSSDALGHKEKAVIDFIDRTGPALIWDLGANTGRFSRIAGSRGIRTVSFDVDPASVEINYLECVRTREARVLPLLLDLTNPTSGIGWGNQERMSIIDRGPSEVVLALALIHHLVISNNVPFEKIADFFSKICKFLIIEFVPKNDSQVQRLLLTRKDIFSDYVEPVFEKKFERYFTILDSVRIRDSERTLYLMQRI